METVVLFIRAVFYIIAGMIVFVTALIALHMIMRAIFTAYFSVKQHYKRGGKNDE